MIDVTLAVLAGGAGSRMGIAKNLLMIEGQPIVTRLHERLAWRGPTLLITSPGREKPPGAERFDREVVDAIADQGPLRGIATALEFTATEIVVVIPVDMPWLERGPLEELAEHLKAATAKAGEYFLTGSDWPRPLPAALRKSSLLSALAAIDRRELSVRRWFDGMKVVPISPNDGLPDQFWKNLNEPKDVASL